MKTKLILGCLLASQILFAQAKINRGGVDGGGAKGVACYGEDKKIVSLELLDLYEAKLLYGLKLQSPEGSVDEKVEAIQKRFLPGIPMMWVSYAATFDRVRKIMRFVPPGVGLKPVNDAAEVLLPENCKLVQLANYVDDELLLFSQEYWDLLDDVNRAALITHEAVYKYERSFGAKDSRRSRKIVGHLFSDFKFNATHESTDGRDLCFLTVGKKKVGLFAQKVGWDGTTNIQYIIFNGKLVYSLKWARLPFEITSRKMPPECTGRDYCGYEPISLSSNFESADQILPFVKLETKNGLQRVRTYFGSPEGDQLVTCNQSF